MQCGDLSSVMVGLDQTIRSSACRVDPRVKPEDDDKGRGGVVVKQGSFRSDPSYCSVVKGSQLASARKAVAASSRLCVGTKVRSTA